MAHLVQQPPERSLADLVIKSTDQERTDSVLNDGYVNFVNLEKAPVKMIDRIYRLSPRGEKPIKSLPCQRHPLPSVFSPLLVSTRLTALGSPPLSCELSSSSLSQTWGRLWMGRSQLVN
jgi:hypothetical protein